MKWLVLLPVFLFAAEPEPVLRSWVMSANVNEAVRAITPDVHSVRSDERYVYVESAGLSLHSFGALEANQYAVAPGPRRFTFRIPRVPKPAGEARVGTPLGVVGVLATGVPMAGFSAR